MLDTLDVMKVNDQHLYERYAPLRVSVPTGKRGPWTVSKFTTKVDLSYLRFWRDGRSPGLGEFTKLSHIDRGVVMSDTCPEIDDLGRYVTKLHGDVLVTGLGLGMAIHMMLCGDLKTVTAKIKSITVVEVDADVIKLTGGYYLKKYPKRVKIVHADAKNWLPPAGTKFDAAWHDIWDFMNGATAAEAKAMKYHYAEFVRGRTKSQYHWGQHEYR